jgi:truncated hemoglobin YjbI
MDAPDDTPAAAPRVDVLAAVGGLEGMRAILRDAYARFAADLMIGFFFRGRDLAQLVEHQLRFTARALGADVVYEGRPIPEAHAALPPILPGHFDRRHALLAQVLREHAVPDDAREAWLAYDRSFRRAVLASRRPAPP